MISYVYGPSFYFIQRSKKYGEKILSAALCNSLSAAYMDVGDGYHSDIYYRMSGQFKDGDPEYKKNIAKRYDHYNYYKTIKWRLLKYE